MKLVNSKITFLAISFVTLFASYFSLGSISKSAEIQSEEYVKIKSRTNVTQKFILIKPDNPVASVILLPGGIGAPVLGSTGNKPTIKYTSNFVVRTRRDFAKQGLMVAIVDAPSDQSKGFKYQWRIGQEHADDISGVVSYLKKQADIPIWLVGTSASSFSAANGAIRLKENIDGIVLSSSVTIERKNRKFYKTHPNGILNMDLDKITVPTLLVSNRDDKCDVTPPDDAEKIKSALKNSPKVEALYFTGGKEPKSEPCGPESPHGFYGIEDQVVLAIADFIKSNSQ